MYGNNLPHFFVLFVILLYCNLSTQVKKKYSEDVKELRERMLETKIIPLIIPTVPTHRCQVFYPSGEGIREVDTGERLRHYEVENAPLLIWPTRENTLYTIYMAGMTKFDPANHLMEVLQDYDKSIPTTVTPPQIQQWEQWLVINIPGLNISGGDEILSYMAPRIPLPTVTEYYIVLIYEQLCKYWMAPDELKSYRGYYFGPYHTVERYTTKYRLGLPWAGDFYYLYKKNMSVYSEEGGIRLPEEVMKPRL